MAGGYPPVALRRQAARRKAWFQSYLMTILQRDVRDLANIADLTTVPQLLSVVASRAGGLLNFADMSRSLSLPQTTLKRYFALLETTFLAQLLRPWSVNTGRRVIRTPKTYLNDTGLFSHLLGLTQERLELDAGLAGAALENFVLMELRKQWSNFGPIQEGDCATFLAVSDTRCSTYMIFTAFLTAGQYGRCPLILKALLAA
jgi:predicted AAA+ superfamily ATPase